jgi:hypothetical protein
MIKRPSSKELYDRIRQAKILVDDGPIYLPPSLHEDRSRK